MNEDGNFLGFINYIFQKCYLPNMDYIQDIQIDNFNILKSNGNYDKIKNQLHTMFENANGKIYINRHALVEDDEHDSIFDNISVGYNGLEVSSPDGTLNYSVFQNVQERSEISAYEHYSSNISIFRVINKYEDIKKELIEKKALSQKYESKIHSLRREQTRINNIIANSNEMKRVFNVASKVALVDSTVLIQGQSGVGKGVVSRFIHQKSSRNNGPFIVIDCGAIPTNLLESELFGYVPGAFTSSAKEGKVGLVELANNGTLFLDEIGELPLDLQTKILRVIQDRKIMKIGAEEIIPVNIRIIAATNRNLEDMVKQNNFRQDLYYRLSVVPINIPPLCERKDDIKPLVEISLKKFNLKYSFKKKIDAECMNTLIEYNWPGNVRELENIVEYLVVTSNSDIINKNTLPPGIQSEDLSEQISLENVESLNDAIRIAEVKLLSDAMNRSKSTAEMADILKLDRSTISRKLKKYNLKVSFNNDL